MNSLPRLSNRTRIAAALAVWTVSVAGCADKEIACTSATCRSGATLTLQVEGTLEQLKTRTLEACLNDKCIRAPLSVFEAEDDGVAFVSAPDLATIEATRSDSIEVTVKSAASGLLLNLSYNLYDDEGTRDGDRYRVRILTADGSVLQTWERVAKYQIVEPNGPACGPVCVQVDFEP